MNKLSAEGKKSVPGELLYKRSCKWNGSSNELRMQYGDKNTGQWNTFAYEYIAQLHYYLYLVIYCTSDVAQIKIRYCYMQL
jgi:hypothetical protein